MLAVLGFLWPWAITKLGHPEMSQQVAPPWIIEVLSIVVFLVAFFKAWRAEYRQRIGVQDELKRQTQPALVSEIIGMGFTDFDVTDGTKILSPYLVLIDLAIVNHGAPSTAYDFRIYVVLPSGETHQLATWYTTDMILVQGKLMPPNTMIAHRVVDTSIQQGVRVVGHLMVIPRVQDAATLTRKVIQVPGSIFRVTCLDVKKNLITAEYVLPELSGSQIPYTPGLFVV